MMGLGSHTTSSADRTTSIYVARRALNPMCSFFFAAVCLLWFSHYRVSHFRNNKEKNLSCFYTFYVKTASQVREMSRCQKYSADLNYIRNATSLQQQQQQQDNKYFVKYLDWFQINAWHFGCVHKFYNLFISIPAIVFF